jgi:predicted DNA-binding transcriptional regulator AlpA
MPIAQIHSPQLPLTETEAAALIGVKRNTLAVWRMQGRGPKFRKVGRSVRYSPSEIDRYLASVECSNTVQSGKVATNA